MNNSALATSNTADRDEAVARAERIRAGIRSMSELQQDIADAYHARDWETLGYQTWDSYVTGEFGGAMPRLDRTERRELVVNLRAEGLSTRAIAAATGVDQKTVVNDQRAVRSGEEISSPGKEAEPDRPVTGLDGKTYEPKNPQRGNKEEPEEPKEPTAAKQASRRQPLPDFAHQAGWELRKAVERIERIVEDDRLSANKDKVAANLRSHLAHAITVCQDLMNKLTETM